MKAISLRNVSLYCVACREAFGDERHISKTDFGEIVRYWIGQPGRRARLPVDFACDLDAEATIDPGKSREGARSTQTRRHRRGFR